jgi:hypothetical protein
MANPVVIAEVIFLRRDEGGRGSVVHCGFMPHIVIQNRSTRAVTCDKDGRGNEDYLGVRFVECPPDYELGSKGRFEMELMYFSKVDYSQVIPGAEFTIRKGGRIIGHGEIQSRDKLTGE